MLWHEVFGNDVSALDIVNQAQTDDEGKLAEWLQWRYDELYPNGHPEREEYGPNQFMMWASSIIEDADL